MSVSDKRSTALIPKIHIISFVQVAREMLTQQNQLQAEIDFWKEMIQCQERSKTGRTLERMQQALALAERKLQMLEHSSPELDAGMGDWTNPLSESRQQH